MCIGRSVASSLWHVYCVAMTFVTNWKGITSYENAKCEL